MGWIDAVADVARVHHVKARYERADEVRIDHTVHARRAFASSELDDAVATRRQCSLPEPAAVLDDLGAVEDAQVGRARRSAFRLGLRLRDVWVRNVVPPEMLARSTASACPADSLSPSVASRENNQIVARERMTGIAVRLSCVLGRQRRHGAEPK